VSRGCGLRGRDGQADDAGQALDVEVDQVAGMIVFIANHGRRRIGLGAGELEDMSAEEFSAFERELDLCGCCGTAIAGRGEVHAVVGEHGVDFIGHGLDQRLEEVGCYPLRGLFMHLDKGELGGAVDGDQEIELALSCADLRDIDMKVADRVCLPVQGKER